MKILFTLLLLIISHNSFAQQIGERADVILYLIQQNFESRKTKDILKYGELQYTYEVKYNDGVIRQIIVNQKNEIFHDLEVRSDVIFNYLFFEGKLIEIQTEFLDLSHDYVKVKFEEKYGHRHHGYNMYFTPNYKHVRCIVDNGQNAVIMFSDYLPSNSESLEFKNLIQKKQKEYVERQN
ncbi:MAG: hypothetical protein ACWA5P_13950 [bacterium]